MSEPHVPVVNQLKAALAQLTQALIDVLPPLIVPVVVALCAALWARRAAPDVLNRATDGQGAPAIVLETLFFGLVGVALAYLSYMTDNGLIAQITSNLVAGLAVLLQLLGLTTDRVKPPFARMNILLGATSAALSFIVAARYYAVAFGAAKGMTGG